MIICPDDFRVTAEGLYDASPEASTLAWRTSFAMLEEYLKEASVFTMLVGVPGSGKSTWAKPFGSVPDQIVFDATFTRRIEREPVIEIAKRHSVSVQALVFLTPISICIARNWERSEDRRVPYPVIASMHDNLRREPVTLDEGFDLVVAQR